MKIYIVMGVSGVGKSTIGRLLSEKLEIPFYDADDFHSVENISKMKNKIALVDEDRHQWLKTIAGKIKEWHKGEGAVLACSALKEVYRQELKVIPEEDLIWIYLHSEFDVILQRVAERKGHYFGKELLMSQYKILESPEYGIHVNVNTTVEEVIGNIMKAISKVSKSEIGLIGLGVMGKSLALNFASKGINISVYNRQVKDKEVDVAKKFALEHESQYEFTWFDEISHFISSLEKPRNILLMVNAGKAVDMVIEEISPFLNAEDLIIDGGNSYFKDTHRREKELLEKGILFMGLGISGGEEGALKGPSLMPGGSKLAYDRVGKILEKIAAKDKEGNPCCAFLGPEGSGHFVKMVHNGIEYGEMQIIAEIYQLLRFGYGQKPSEIAEKFEEWNLTFKSYLLEITVEILRKKEEDNFLIDKILDAAGQKGTGGWSTNSALELGVPLDTITAAVMARNISGEKERRIKAEKAYNLSGNIPSGNDNPENDIFEQLFRSFRAASIINHATGFDLLARASKGYKWDLNLAEVARVWTNGCIIRSGLMEDLANSFKKNNEEHLMLHPEYISILKEEESSLKKIISESLKKNIPCPVLSAAANYFLNFISAQSSANIIQAQRDYFGAHTFERTDHSRGTFFHHNWKTPSEE